MTNGEDDMSDTTTSAASLDYQREQGRKTRAAILATIARMERDGERPTVRAIAAELPVSRGAVGQHVKLLADHGLVETKRGRHGWVRLTDTGRLVN